MHIHSWCKAYQHTVTVQFKKKKSSVRLTGVQTLGECGGVNEISAAQHTYKVGVQIRHSHPLPGLVHLQHKKPSDLSVSVSRSSQSTHIHTQSVNITSTRTAQHVSLGTV